MTTTTIKDIEKEKMVWLLNAIGEETGHDIIPEEVSKWYDEVFEDKEWLQYLVKYNDGYGILALWEIDHPTSESWNDESTGSQDPEWRKLNGAQIWFRLKRFCEKIAKVLELDVFLGQKTGIFAQHELAFFIPFGISKEEYGLKFKEIEEYTIETESLEK